MKFGKEWDQYINFNFFIDHIFWGPFFRIIATIYRPDERSLKMQRNFCY